MEKQLYFLMQLMLLPLESDGYRAAQKELLDTILSVNAEKSPEFVSFLESIFGDKELSEKSSIKFTLPRLEKIPSLYSTNFHLSNICLSLGLVKLVCIQKSENTFQTLNSYDYSRRDFAICFQMATLFVLQKVC